MKPNDIIGKLMAALGKIAETENVLEATSLHDWKRRATLIASKAIDQAKKDLRRQSQNEDIPDKDITHD